MTGDTQTQLQLFYVVFTRAVSMAAGCRSDNSVDSQEGLVCGNMMICFLGYHEALTGF